MPPLGISVLRCVRLLRVFKVTKWVLLFSTCICKIKSQRYLTSGEYSAELLDSREMHFVFLSLQILEIAIEFSGLPTELYTIDRLAAAPAFSLHRHLRPSGHAGRFNVATRKHIYLPTHTLHWFLQRLFFERRSSVGSSILARWKRRRVTISTAFGRVCSPCFRYSIKKGERFDLNEFIALAILKSINRYKNIQVARFIHREDV